MTPDSTVWGDEMHDYLLDGYDSNEEISEFAEMMNPYEKEKAIKFSKRGVIQFINKTI
jgi:hypothetical protein